MSARSAGVSPLGLCAAVALPEHGIRLPALREELQVAEELRDAGEDLSDLDNIASPHHAIRNGFDLMPTGSAEDWATVVAMSAEMELYGQKRDPGAGHLACLRHRRRCPPRTAASRLGPSRWVRCDGRQADAAEA